MDDMTEKRNKEQLDKEGGPNGRHDRKKESNNNLTKMGVQIDDMTDKRVKEQLDKEGGPNRHDREESPSRVTRQRRGSKWTT